MFNKTIAIVYLCWSDEPLKYLDAALQAIMAQTYPKEQMELIVVYNAHKENESSAAPLIAQKLFEYQDRLPVATFLEQDKNLGYVGGNNVGIKTALQKKVDYILLHNADGRLDSEAIQKLSALMQSDEQIGASQPLIVLDPANHLINSAGNEFHYLGFAYCGQYRQNIKQIKSVYSRSVGYLSGSAIMMRSDLLTKHGLLDEDYFIYHDDLEYSLRLQSRGYTTKIEPSAVFFHQYQFSRNKEKYYLMERNRLFVLLTYYKIPTLLLVAPMMLMAEIGLVFFAVMDGWLKQKLRAYIYWLKPASWRLIWRKRKIAQKARTISDRRLLSKATAQIEFEEVDCWILKYLANPIMTGYWQIIKIIIFW
ncbi:MAG: hypothetical protein COU31_02080 [Candidatus Magasanikbacteria bacterium CG10_big_fil_rev_8_21_14_0_10_40_10]|uniref:Glycosyltransferase 2-like domain-containing protein n=1 Tax=Candidatus Magasanikbacteria bacterium CG10_big_fil_rev_8_21_14_0_10_40_10 TaxID=1974648 RepID=A0A2M6W494_9BACT|nr:MAG: hypothetical protein COU31_02080 [Candidatus Magasanikbacteria bacterium CG10_big_fil_rev_8_21_14_0_10_40_10]